MLKYRRKEKGVALIMVLMIVAIMTVVVTSTIYKNRLLIKEAELQKNHAKGSLIIKTVKADLIQVLTTTPTWVVGPTKKLKDKYQLPKDMNFYGTSFKYHDLNVKIQDLSGLVSLYPFDEDGFLLLLKSMGIKSKERNILLDSIKDWQDSDHFKRLNGAEKQDYLNSSLPRNGTIQVIDEVLLIKGMTSEIWDKISPYIVLFGRGGISTQYIPDDRLDIFGSDFDQKNIIEKRKALRENGENPTAIMYGGELTYPGRRLLITISMPYQESQYTESFVIVRTRGMNVPYVIADNIVGTYEN